jgi:hypothetical protein
MRRGRRRNGNSRTRSNNNSGPDQCIGDSTDGERRDWANAIVHGGCDKRHGGEGGYVGCIVRDGEWMWIALNDDERIGNGNHLHRTGGCTESGDGYADSDVRDPKCEVFIRNHDHHRAGADRLGCYGDMHPFHDLKRGDGDMLRCCRRIELSFSVRDVVREHWGDHLRRSAHPSGSLYENQRHRHRDEHG